VDIRSSPAAVFGALHIGMHGRDADEDDEELSGEEGKAREDEDHPSALGRRGELGHQGDAGGQGDAHGDADQSAGDVDGAQVFCEGRPANARTSITSRNAGGCALRVRGADQIAAGRNIKL
jgi:hypothetical protein